MIDDETLGGHLGEHPLISSAQLFVPGEPYEAVYRDEDQPFYRGNPWIEALAADLPKKDVLRQLTYLPPYAASHRDIEDVMTRIHLIDSVRRMFVPFEKTYELAVLCSRMIREGYVARNPLDVAGRRQARNALDVLQRGGDALPFIAQADCPISSALGSSGIGKSTNAMQVLRLQPQVIVHHQCRGVTLDTTQLVYLRLICPSKQMHATRALCLAFFQQIDQALGTTFYRIYGKDGRATENEMIFSMARVAQIVNLGLLVLDEIQFLLLD
jgi:hypothetical protein